MKSKIRVILAITVSSLIILVAVLLYLNRSTPGRTGSAQRQNQAAVDYNPEIIPAHFSTVITNKYFSLPIGKKLVFEATTKEGIYERTEIEILKETKTIDGVETLVYLDRVFNNGQLVEETRDYLAQHNNGDVWYFGEDVNNYEHGTLKDHDGSFLHGNDGAKAGIWIKAKQKIGDSYRQEYYPGEAEDIRDTVDTGVAVTTKLGSYTDCIKTYDWTPLDVTAREYKYYCPQTNSLVLVEDLETDKRTELTHIETLQ